MLHFVGTPIIRKEHFGTLILMQDGRRHVTSNRYFDVLRLLASGDTAEITEETHTFLRELEERGIVEICRSSAAGAARFIDNPCISRDCLSFPRVVYWECTNRCNLKCLHCYSRSGAEAKEEALTKEQVFHLIDELSEFGCEFLCMGGGEPALHPGFLDVISRCTDKRLGLEVTTNGTLVDDALIGEMKSRGLKFVQVSIDGATAETYNSIRAKGDFALVCENAAKLGREFILSVCTVATKTNLAEMDALIELSKHLGAKHFRVLPLMHMGRAALHAHLRLDDAELRKLNELLLQRKKEERSLHIQLNENLVVPERKNVPWMPEEHYGCSAGRSTCLINAAGDVFPCSFMGFDQFRCGSIRDDSLLDIWTHSSVLKSLRELSHVDGKCAACRYLPDCRGGCRAAAFMEHGSISAEDPLCTIASGGRGQAR